jgi:hypothetical protein
LRFLGSWEKVSYSLHDIENQSRTLVLMSRVFSIEASWGTGKEKMKRNLVCFLVELDMESELFKLVLEED